MKKYLNVFVLVKLYTNTLNPRNQQKKEKNLIKTKEWETNHLKIENQELRFCWAFSIEETGSSSSNKTQEWETNHLQIENQKLRFWWSFSIEETGNSSSNKTQEVTVREPTDLKRHHDWVLTLIYYIHNPWINRKPRGCFTCDVTAFPTPWVMHGFFIKQSTLLWNPRSVVIYALNLLWTVCFHVVKFPLQFFKE